MIAVTLNASCYACYPKSTASVRRLTLRATSALPLRPGTLRLSSPVSSLLRASIASACRMDMAT
jgi:hypothetical protein